jgi:hypothetical protein
MNLLERLRTANLVVALALGAFAFAIVVTTFLPGSPYVSDEIVGTLFVFVFPVLGAAIFREAGTLQRSRSGRSTDTPRRARTDSGGLRRLLSRVPQPLRIGFHVFFFAMWLAALSSFVAGPSGQPIERDGRYFLNDHGELTEISQDEYDHARSTWARTFAAVPAAFFATAALLSAYGPLLRPDAEAANRPDHG